MLTITCISDTHDQHSKLTIDPTFLLIHTGDATCTGKLTGLIEFLNWFAAQPACYKIFVPGNHDRKAFKKHTPLILELSNNRGIHTLLNARFTTANPAISIWGAPLLEKPASYPDLPIYTDILASHEPPWGLLDKVGRPPREGEDPEGHIGNLQLLQTQAYLHTFGHIHEAFGLMTKDIGRFNKIPSTFVNASMCNREDCQLVNKPIVFNIQRSGSIVDWKTLETINKTEGTSPTST